MRLIQPGLGQRETHSVFGAYNDCIIIAHIAILLDYGSSECEMDGLKA